MFTFQVLGGIDLRAADGRSLLSVLSQPKRTAILAYLAIEGPGKFHRRDTLIGIFWPEMSEQRARNSLSQALHYLRRSLGDGVIASRGDGEVGLVDGSVWCDVVAFEEAIRECRAADALELYRGELLPGLNLDGVPDFERWLDRARASQRERAAGAAWRLAEEAQRAGELAGAVAWARRAMELRPEDEASLRRLLVVLDQAGDRAGALTAYDDFARWLNLEYDAEPARETVELIDEIRRRSNGNDGFGPSAETGGGVAVGETVGSGAGLTAAELAVVGAPAVGTPPVGSPAARSPAEGSPGAETGVAHSSAPRRLSGQWWAGPRWTRWAALAGLVVISVLVTLFIRESSDPGIVPGTDYIVAVFPFEVRGATELSYLGRGMTDLLSTKLDGATELRSSDPRAVLSAVDAAGSSVGDPRAAHLIARRLGAGRFILGSLTEYGGSVQLSATLYQVDRAEPLVRTSVEGSVDQIFDLVDRLAAELLAEQHPGPGHELVRLAATTTNSLPALKSYLLGEEALRGGHYGLAMEQFREAADLDTTFALAYYRLGVAAIWGSSSAQLSRWAIQRAIDHDTRLSARARTLLQAFRAFVGRDAIEAERLYRAVLASHPDDFEAWYQLGEVLFHYRPLLGAPVEASGQAFERALSLEPGHGESLIHLVRLASRRGDRIAFDSLVSRLVAGSVGSDRLLEIQALRAAAWHDSIAWGLILSSAYQLRDQDIWKLLVSTVTNGGDPEAVVQLARLQTHPSRDPVFRGLGYGMAAQLELARGRWGAARAQLAELSRLEPTAALVIASIFAASPLTPATRAEIEELHASLSGIDRRTAPEILSTIGTPRTLLPFVQHYLAGLLSVRFGDPALASTHIRALRELGGIGVEPDLGPELARSIVVALAWSEGETSRTLAELAATSFEPKRFKAMLGYSSQSFERYLYGEALAAAGRDDEALSWFESFPEADAYDLIYLAPSHLRRAEIHERRGDRDRAISHYNRFIELWRECDPELAPLVEAARERLAHLVADQ